MKQDVFIVAGVRSSIGDFGGCLRQLSPIELATPVIRAVLAKSGLPKERVGKVILGNTLSPINPNVARKVAMTCEIPGNVPAYSIHCACASAMQALISGASALALGEAETALVGGVESMSNAPFILSALRWGQRLRHAELMDLLWWGMQEDPIMGGMGQAADFLARQYRISREEQDELAALSHHRALQAQSDGHFADEIVPIEVAAKPKSILVLQDEHPREDATFTTLNKLRPAFSPDGTVSAGNSSSLNDGAAAVVLATDSACKEHGLTPIASIKSWAITAVEPKWTGIAPVSAIREVERKSGITLPDLDLIEINEAFASYYLACEKDLKLDRSKVNVNGSGISLGHPVGATGVRIVVTLLHEMMRRGASNGLAGLCAGGGMGYALHIERRG